MCVCVAAYVELPDGKVLSGTECGNLLLWDGGFIKVEISRKNKRFCHHVRAHTHTHTHYTHYTHTHTIHYTHSLCTGDD